MPTTRQPTIHVAVDGVRAPLSRSRAAAVVAAVLRAEKVRGALVSVAFVSKPAIARMNARHLDHRGPTDVISFGFDRPTAADPVVGDIYIAPEVAAENARASRRPVREELVRLLVHGTLHVLGYDHPEDDMRERSTMWRRQERLVNRLGRATPTSVRTSSARTNEARTNEARTNGARTPSARTSGAARTGASGEKRPRGKRR